MDKIIFLILILTLYIILILCISISYSEPFKNIFIAKVWETNPKEDIFFPEKCLPRFNKKNITVGLAYSGGGNRSFSSIMGYIRYINKIGLYKNVDYISSVSGGSWFNGVYSFAMSKGFSPESLLGKSLDIKNMSVINLEKENFNNNYFMGKCLRDGQVIKHGLYALSPGNGIKYSDAWSYLIGKIFLEPYGLNQNVPCTLNKEMASQININNKTNLDILKLQDTDPFWICNGTLQSVGNDFIKEFLISEFTPMYSGFLKSNILSNNLKIGGYVVETFAFGCQYPTKGLNYSNIIEKYKEFCNKNPFLISANNIENKCFTLRDMLGISSSAYSKFYYDLTPKSKIPDLTLFTPTFNVWFKNILQDTTSDNQCTYNIFKNRCETKNGFDEDSCRQYLGKCYSMSAKQCTNNTDCSFNKNNFTCDNIKNGSSLNCRNKNFSCECVKSSNTYKKKDYKSIPCRIGDGLTTDNLGILSLLSRNVNRIICFANSNLRIFDDRGNVIKDSDGNELCYRDIQDLFGIQKNKNCDTDKFVNTQIQIFDSSEYYLVFEDFKKTFLKGGPTFSRRSLNVIKNELYGVKGGYKVDILFLLLQPSLKFNSLLPSDVKNEISKKYSNFPNFKTLVDQPLQGVINLTGFQINLLSSYTEWCIQQPELSKHIIELLS
jgi:hypothetical protein